MGCCESAPEEAEDKVSRWANHQQEVIDRVIANKSDDKRIWFGGSDDYCIEVIEALQKYNTHASYVEVAGCSQVTSRFCKALAPMIAANKMPSVVILSVRNNPRIDDEGMKLLCDAMKTNHHVLEFNTDGCGSSHATAVSLAEVFATNMTLVECCCQRNNDWGEAELKLIAAAIKTNYRKGGSLMWIGMGYMGDDWNETKASIMEDVYNDNPQINLDLPYIEGRRGRKPNKNAKDVYNTKREELQKKYGADHW